LVPVLRLTAIQVLALGGLAVALGLWLKRRIPVLDRLHIPAPIAGGLLFATLTFALRDRVANFEMDTSLRDMLLIASFTAIGMNASLKVLKVGGIQVLIVAALAAVGGAMQAGVGMGVASLVGLDPRVGILAGTISLAGGPATSQSRSITLAGGPATSLSFGPIFEQLGVPGATTIAITSATFGITIAGLIAGWTGGRLIRKRDLKPAPVPERETQNVERETSNALSVLGHILLVTTAMGVGSLLHWSIARTGFVLPPFVSTLLVAVAIRNLDDRFQWFGISSGVVTQIVTVTLSLFIGMAMLTLRLWELTALALPLFVVLVAGIVATYLFCSLVAFRVLGKDYEAAVMTAGFTGFMIGITPNAMASMQELASKYGPSPRALLVIPLIGGFLVDVTNSIIITGILNFQR
jgi:ESS family glutamate:Na+ symporter